MQQCTIILPIEIEGKDIDLSETHSKMIEEVVKAVGNCHTNQVVQFYRDENTDKFGSFEALEYKFAFPEDYSRDKNEFLLDLAKKYGKLCQTKYVYIVSALGVSQFIDVTK